MTQFNNVSAVKKGTVYFDGKCISHEVIFADGSRKTLGVILPSTLTFNVSVPEIMEITSGSCRVKLGDATDFTTYEAGSQFSVPSNGRFIIHTDDVVNYVCSYG